MRRRCGRLNFGRLANFVILTILIGSILGNSYGQFWYTIMQIIEDEIQTRTGGRGERLRRYIEHPLGLPIALFFGLVTLSVLVVWIVLWQSSRNPTVRARENYIVILNYDEKKQIVPTDERTVGSLLKRMGIVIKPGDRVEPAENEDITGDNFLVNIYRSAPVAIIDGARQTFVSSAAATPRSVVAETKTQLYSEDLVSASLTDNFLLQKSLGYRAVIDRAVPVTMQLYGKPLMLRTRATTVEALLKEKGVKLDKEDTVRPATNTPLTDGMQVAVVRNGIQVFTVDESIPAPVQNVIDASLSFGSSAVRQEGSPGKVTNTYEVKVENGVEVSRKLLQTVRVTEPVPRIVAKGNTVNIPADKQAVMAAAGVSPSDYAYVDYIFSRESRWNAAALNAGGCGGLGQACPASKLANVCPNWQADPVCQTRWFSGYASRYGGWAGAYNAWLTKHWW